MTAIRESRRFPFIFHKKTFRKSFFVFVRALQASSLRYSRIGFLPPPPPLDGTHFSTNSLNSDKAVDAQPGHACRMSCDLSELLEQSRPPDKELVDLIEQAFLEGQIDGQRADPAHLWLSANRSIFMLLRKLNVGLFVVLILTNLNIYFINNRLNTQSGGAASHELTLLCGLLEAV
jgi:hypothetical protein